MRNFHELYAGRNDVRGEYLILPGTKPNAQGKLTGEVRTFHEPVTEKTYQDHIDGTKRLGIVPIMPNTNEVWWFAIDVDEYKSPDLYKKLALKISRAALPLVMTKSKSGGIHLWCFFREPVSAQLARHVAAQFIRKLKLPPQTEVFPKQDTIQEEDDGNWINIPYHGKCCKGLDQKGEHELTFKEFVLWANKRIVDIADVTKAAPAKDAPPATDPKAELADDGGEGAKQGIPPCIARMFVEGVEEGGRDQALTHIGIYLVRAHNDDWEERMTQINEEFFHPPMPFGQVAKIIKSLKNKNYQYLCGQQPMQSLCNKGVCLTRKYGVGNGGIEGDGDIPIVIDAIVKIDGEEPLYQVTLYEKRITVDAETLYNFAAFQIAAMKRLNRILPQIKRGTWTNIVNEQMTAMTEIIPPAETQMKQRIIDKFKDWVDQSTPQGNPDVLSEGMLYFSGTSIFFRGRDFMNMVDKQMKVSRDQVWLYLNDWGVVENTLTINDVKTKVWQYPLDPKDTWFKPEAKRALA